MPSSTEPRENDSMSSLGIPWLIVLCWNVYFNFISTFYIYHFFICLFGVLWDWSFGVCHFLFYKPLGLLQIYIMLSSFWSLFQFICRIPKSTNKWVSAPKSVSCVLSWTSFPSDCFVLSQLFVFLYLIVFILLLPIRFIGVDPIKWKMENSLEE